jgi:hypothetical protein
VQPALALIRAERLKLYYLKENQINEVKEINLNARLVVLVNWAEKEPEG